MCTTKGERPFQKTKTEEKTMSERTSRQVEEMKKQTIGVEIEMAEITV